MSLQRKIGKEILFFDGAMGSMIQKHNFTVPPEILNISNPQIITDIHEKYIEAGSDIISTNTFGAYSHKFGNLEQIISRAIINAKAAVLKSKKEVYIALDMGPSGKLLKPLGDLEFSDAYEIFKETAILGEKYGADLVILETFSDTYEAKAAILAIKENTNLPIFCTMTFDENQKTLTGGDVLTMVSLLEGLGVDALGINCGLGPKQIEPMVKEILKYSSIPVMIQPNAGLPKSVNGKTVYDLDAEEFSESMKRMCMEGALILGGCCGTTPEYIQKTVEKCKPLTPVSLSEKEYTFISSGSRHLLLGREPLIIGERINPTGKKKLKEALINKDMDMILQEAIDQKEAGAHILDVNMGLPEINEVEYIVDSVKAIQAISDLPLQIDSSTPEVIEAALRVYNGKPLINSVSGKKESMEKIFPLVKKYGGVVIGLVIDENGIPETAEARYDVAKKIIDTAEEYGIKRKNIVIDPLTLTVSAQQKEAIETLTALRNIKQGLNVKTILGVSNVSFGIPNRQSVNSTFFALALQAGLDLCIINPLSDLMMGTYRAYKIFAGLDENCREYISCYSDKEIVTDTVKNTSRKASVSFSPLEECVVKGLKDIAYIETKKLLETTEPFDIINSHIVTALDYVGSNFETGKMFLPQLIMSAESAKRSFDAIKEHMDKQGKKTELKGKIVLATVFGDSHDIGKNIVKAILENYGYEIIDLGKDVPIETVVSSVVENDIKLVGLSALMTTTVVNMEKTIEKVKEVMPQCKIMVGGAVLNEDYAKMINADFYAKDALSAIPIAKEIFGK